jgi:hypothetical protein
MPPAYRFVPTFSAENGWNCSSWRFPEARA